MQIIHREWNVQFTWPMSTEIAACFIYIWDLFEISRNNRSLFVICDLYARSHFICPVGFDLWMTLFRYISKLDCNLLLVMIKASLLTGSCPPGVLRWTCVTDVPPGPARWGGGGGLPRAWSVADWRTLLDSEKKETHHWRGAIQRDVKTCPAGFWNMAAYLDLFYNMKKRKIRCTTSD